MTSPHATIMETGQWFGYAVVSVDLEAMDCVIRFNHTRHEMRRIHLVALDEIDTAVQGLHSKQNLGEVERDLLAALTYAGKQIYAQQLMNGRDNG